MAFAATVVWEVQPGVGAANNGGGFDPTSGTPGTDYSQQASPQVTYTDLVIDAATNTNCTSAGHPFTSVHVGNILNITSGTGFTVQRVQVMSVAGGVATCDKSLGTLASTGGNGKLGGALDSSATAHSLAVAGNTIYQKSSGTDSVSLSGALAQGSVSLPITWEGYSATRGDLAAQSWSASHNAAGQLTGTAYPALTFTAQAFSVKHLICRCLAITSSTSGYIFNVNSNNSAWFYRCKLTQNGTNAASKVYVTQGLSVFVDCDLTAAGASGNFMIDTNSNAATTFIACRLSGTNCSGVLCNTGAWSFLFCDFRFAASTETAISITSAILNLPVMVDSCTFVNNPGICIALSNSAFGQWPLRVTNCQATGNGTFIINLRSGTAKFPLLSYNNRLRNNTHTYLGFTNIVDDGAGPGDTTTAQTDAQEYVAPAASPPDLHLLSASAGKGVGFPPYLDTGAWQRQEAGGLLVGQGMTGGMRG